jgi:ABC-type amino acid transport substrate-binding protein
MKKLIGAVAFLVVIAAVWFVQQGGLSKLQTGNSTAQDSAGNAGAVSADHSVDAGSTAPVAKNTTADAIPASFKPDPDTLKSIINNGVVRVSVENPSEPFYGESNGSAHGFNVEFARLLFADSSFTTAGKRIVLDTRHEVDTYEGVPKQLLQADASGNHVVDIAMDGLTFPDNTPAGVAYSVPYIDDFGYALIVRHGSAIRSSNDLAGKRVGILKGDPDVRAFVTRQYPNATFIEVDDSDPAFIIKSIDNGNVDAFIYDYPFAVDSIKGSDLKFAVTKLDGSNIAYKIGIRAQDQSLLIYLNAAIAKVRQTPEYLELLRKYFISQQTETTAAQTGEHMYKVKQGDTLNMISSAQLGNGQRYREIQRRNNLANPNLILAGQQLVIPAR